MRSRVASGASLVLLAGPTVLAFFAGGYFDAPRIWAGLIAWALVAVAMVVVPSPLPRRRGAQLAVIGLGLLAVWTLVSYTWAPLAGSAYHAGQRVFLYAAVLLAAGALLRTNRIGRAVEPVLAAGTVVVIGYGLAGRMLPGLLHYARSISAEGRLEQPLTYWNAMGEVAAIGLVLAARLAGDRTRPGGLRIAAAAATAPLGMGLYLSFSRGALFACAAGLVTLIVAAPTRAQFRALVLAVVAGGLAAAVSAPFAGLTSLSGALSARERQGAITLIVVVGIMVAAALVQRRLQGRESDAALRLPRRAPLIALGVICAGLALAIVAGAHESSSQPLAPGATRYESLQSSRYAYWRVALRAFGDEPIRGVGAGGWAVYWLKYRPFAEGAQDAHSLPLQTAAELGLIGVALLAAFLIGVAMAGARALRLAPSLAAGPVAGFVVYAAHAPLDWDWEMPAVTLIALILAGALLAIAEGEPASTVPPATEAVDPVPALTNPSTA
jgi:O-antigen ligase